MNKPESVLETDKNFWDYIHCLKKLELVFHKFISLIKARQMVFSTYLLYKYIYIYIYIWKKIMDSNPTVCEEKLTSNSNRRGRFTESNGTWILHNVSNVR